DSPTRRKREGRVQTLQEIEIARIRKPAGEVARRKACVGVGRADLAQGFLLELDSRGVRRSDAQEIHWTPIEPPCSAQFLALDVRVLNRADEGRGTARKIREEFDGSKGLSHRVDVQGHSGREPVNHRVGNGQSRPRDSAVDLLERTGCQAVREIKGRPDYGGTATIERGPV